MKPFIPLSETEAGKIHSCNNGACINCRNKQEMLQQSVAPHPDSDNNRIFQLFYEALLQGYLANISGTNQSGFHCT